MEFFCMNRWGGPKWWIQRGWALTWALDLDPRKRGKQPALEFREPREEQVALRACPKKDEHCIPMQVMARDRLD